MQIQMYSHGISKNTINIVWIAAIHIKKTFNFKHRQYTIFSYRIEIEKKHTIYLFNAFFYFIEDWLWAKQIIKKQTHEVYGQISVSAH